MILGVARSKMADRGGHLEKNVFCNKWKTAYLISIIFQWQLILGVAGSKMAGRGGHLEN